MNKIMFTGGGSAGHVTVNIALMPRFQQEGWSVEYIGSMNGIERELVNALPNVHYWPISTGKLRRYIDWQNVKDPFKVVQGLVQAFRIIKKQKPNIIFSKGGFVSVPVVLAAWLNRVPVIIHESDITPGLANRIAIPFATGVCTTFPETCQELPVHKCRHVGAIIRDAIMQGDAARGRAYCGFNRSKPVLVVMGGSLGARRINQIVREAIPQLCELFQVVHLCGKGQLDSSITVAGYQQYEYLHERLPDVMAMADVVISRAGSNAIFEFLALKKPMLLIPLPKGQSRGDQLVNAQSFYKSGFCEILYEEQLTKETMLSGAAQIYKDRAVYIAEMNKQEQTDALQRVYEWINEAAIK